MGLVFGRGEFKSLIFVITFHNKEFAEWPSNVAYSVQITGKDSNIEQTVTSTTVHLNMCNCNATETGEYPLETNFYVSLENPSCAEFIVGPQTAGMDWWIWLIIVLAVLAFVSK